jgi:molybdopterin converting factor small subunit
LLDKLIIDRDQVESVYVNGKEATFDQRLNAGDRITFLPFIGGG